jgi:hypothetical protein
MHTFKIVRAQRGWAIQMGCAMTTPCRSQAAAIQQAERMAAAIRRYGETVSVVVEPASDDTVFAVAPPRKAAAAQLQTPRRVMRSK